MANKTWRGTVVARTKWNCSFHGDEQLWNLLSALDRHMDSNTIKVHSFCLAKWTEMGIMGAICDLESWLQNQNLYQTKSHLIFFKKLLTSLTLPSFWKYTLNIPQLVSSHCDHFQISVLRTDFLIVFNNNTHTVTLSTTIITLAYHLKATKSHYISTGRNNTTAKCFSKSIQVPELQRPLSTHCSVAMKGMLCSPKSLPSKKGVFMVAGGCLCILGHGIVNLQKRCLGSGSVGVLLIFASQGWVFSSFCCLSHLSLGSFCTVELEGFIIWVQNKITALGSQLLLCIRF